MSSSDKGNLLDLQGSDLQQWRDLPVSKLLIQYLEAEKASALEHIANLVDEEKFSEAKITRGGLKFCITLLSILHPPERMRPEPEEEFIDTATRKLRKEKTLDG